MVIWSPSARNKDLVEPIQTEPCHGGQFVKLQGRYWPADALEMGRQAFSVGDLRLAASRTQPDLRRDRVVLTVWQSAFRRDLGLCLARLAVAYAVNVGDRGRIAGGRARDQVRRIAATLYRIAREHNVKNTRSARADETGCLLGSRWHGDGASSLSQPSRGTSERRTQPRGLLQSLLQFIRIPNYGVLYPQVRKVVRAVSNRRPSASQIDRAVQVCRRHYRRACLDVRVRLPVKPCVAELVAGVSWSTSRTRRSPARPTRLRSGVLRVWCPFSCR